MKTKKKLMMCCAVLFGAAACVLTATWAQADNRPPMPLPGPPGGMVPGGGPGHLFPSPEQMDANQDGAITQEEFIAAWTAFSNKMFAQADQDKNGVLSQEELSTLPGPGQRPRGDRRPGRPDGRGPADMRPGRDSADYPPEPPDGTPPGRDHRRMGPPTQEQMDTDQDGSVTKTEYDTAWQAFILEQFNRMDMDGDGVLIEEELRRGHPGGRLPGPPPPSEQPVE